MERCIHSCFYLIPIKFAAINSDDAGILTNVSGLGDSEVDNFSSTFEGSFEADDDPSSETYRLARFEPDPRYNARRIFVRFKWKPFDQDKWSRRRKFKKNKATFTVDGVKIFSGPGTDVHDKWKNRDKKKKRHQDAKEFYPQIFNNNGNNPIAGFQFYINGASATNASGGISDEVGIDFD